MLTDGVAQGYLFGVQLLQRQVTIMSLTAEEGPPDAAGNAVVVAGIRDVHDLPPGHRHRGSPTAFRNTGRSYPTAAAADRQGSCLSFWASRSFLFRAISLNAAFVFLCCQICKSLH